jgi:hypothetical protein
MTSPATVLAALGLALLLAGCAGKKGPDLSVLTVGATRTDIEKELGRPIESTLNADGTRTNLYPMPKQKPRGNLVTRTLGRTMRGVASLGLSAAGTAASIAAPGAGGIAAGAGTSVLQGALSGSGAPADAGVPEEYQAMIQQYMAAMQQAQVAAQQAGQATPGAPGVPVAPPRVYPPNVFVVTYGADERVLSYRQPAMPQ